jgi:hypothetical protein
VAVRRAVPRAGPGGQAVRLRPRPPGPRALPARQGLRSLLLCALPPPAHRPGPLICSDRRPRTVATAVAATRTAR